MALSELLGTSFECQCGKTHQVPIRELVYARGAVDSLADIVQRCLRDARPRRAAVVADVRTWEICGGRAQEALQRAGLEVSRIMVPDRGARGPMCDDVTCGTLVEQLRPTRADLVVAVGSGVVNDLCKWSSFQMGVPYIVVATAASMNGYSSANVAPTIGGVKMLIEARPPLAVIAEPQVIERAPREMTTAGFGDTIAKHQSNGDWAMNTVLQGEYHCSFCAAIAGDIEPLYLDHPEHIPECRPEAIGGLFEALFWTGMAMTLMGTSIPASGGEHLLSHTLDMMAEVRGESHDLHGRQVGIGTILSAALFERALAIENPDAGGVAPEVDEAFWISPAVARAVREQYEIKRPRLAMIRDKIRQGSLWDQARTRIAAEVKSPGTIRDWLAKAGGATCAADIGCSRERVRSAILHMHEIRKRFTIIDLAWLTGVLPGALDDILDQWLCGSRGS
ncbi:MAG: iron-containing alcohol dehydrogenase [Phycisphaerales bacterium]